MRQHLIDVPMWPRASQYRAYAVCTRIVSRKAVPTPKVAPPIPSCQSKLYVVIIHAQNAEIGIESSICSEKSPMIEPPAQLWGTARASEKLQGGRGNAGARRGAHRPAPASTANH